MTGESRIDPLRLAEASGEAALVLALVTLPVAWRVPDVRLTAVLAAYTRGLRMRTRIWSPSTIASTTPARVATGMPSGPAEARPERRSA